MSVLRQPREGAEPLATNPTSPDFLRRRNKLLAARLLLLHRLDRDRRVVDVRRRVPAFDALRRFEEGGELLSGDRDPVRIAARDPAPKPLAPEFPPWVLEVHAIHGEMKHPVKRARLMRRPAILSEPSVTELRGLANFARALPRERLRCRQRRLEVVQRARSRRVRDSTSMHDPSPSSSEPLERVGPSEPNEPRRSAMLR